MKYYKITFIFSFLRFGIEALRGIEFHHSTYNASRSRLKMGGNLVLNTRFPLPTMLCAGYSVKLNIYLLQEYSQQKFKHFNYSTIERGICVTKTCEKYIQKSKLNIKEDLEHILEGCLNEIIKEKYGLSTRIYRLNCDKAAEEQINIDILDYTVAILFVILLIVIVSGSYYDSQYNNKTNGKGSAGEIFFHVYKYVIFFLYHSAVA